MMEARVIREKILRSVVAAFVVLAVAIPGQNSYSQDVELPKNVCEKILMSNCDSTQEQMLREFLRDLKIYSTEIKTIKYTGQLPALEALPKDHFGMPNWITAVTDGLIKPRGTIRDTQKEQQYEGFFDNLILMQVKAHFMADVAFPHGMHTYWLSCDSCHPEPFQKKVGSSKITMKEFLQGKWCGKCHGKVSFPPSEYENCRRCHTISKASLHIQGNNN